MFLPFKTFKSKVDCLPYQYDQHSHYYNVTYDTSVTFQVAYLANMTSPPGSKAAQHFATFMGKSVSLCITKFKTFFKTIWDEKGHPVTITFTFSTFTFHIDHIYFHFPAAMVPLLVPMVTLCRSPMRASPCSLTTTTTSS